MDYTSLNKEITKLAEYSKHLSSKHYVLEAIISHAYNFCFTEIAQYGARPFPYIPKLTKISYYEAKDEKEEELLVKCLVLLCKLYKNSEPFEDVLTNLYGPMLGTKLGQCMTPPDLSSVLFHLTDSNNELEKHLEKNNTFSIYDPTSGTGSLLLGSLREIYSKYGKETLEKIDLFACDLDMKMCIATAVNLELSSLSHRINYNQLTIYNENSLLGPNRENIFLEILPNRLLHKKAFSLEDTEIKEAA